MFGDRENHSSAIGSPDTKLSLFLPILATSSTSSPVYDTGIMEGDIIMIPRSTHNLCIADTWACNMNEDSTDSFFAIINSGMFNLMPVAMLHMLFTLILNFLLAHM